MRRKYELDINGHLDAADFGGNDCGIINQTSCWVRTAASGKRQEAMGYDGGNRFVVNVSHDALTHEQDAHPSPVTTPVGSGFFSNLKSSSFGMTTI